MNQQVGHLVGPRTQLEDRDTLGEGVNGDPEPKDLRAATQARAHLIKLDVRDLQVREDALVQGLSMGSGPQEPSGNGRLAHTKDPFRRRDIQPFRKPRSARAPPAVRAFSTDTWAYAAVH